EGDAVVVLQLRAALLLAVEQDGALAIDLAQVEIPAVKDDLRVEGREARAVEGDVVPGRAPDGEDLLVDGEALRPPLRGDPAHSRHASPYQSPRAGPQALQPSG